MPIVDVKNLLVKFGDFNAVNNITFSVDAGEIFGFLGTNGAGKTTTIRVLCGLLVPTSGSASIVDLDVYTQELEIKRKIGYMSQRSTLYNDLTVGENLDFISRLHKLDYDLYVDRRQKVLEFIEFEKSLDDLVQDLPGGIKRQVALAASVLHNPDIVFLDEPTAGVSPEIRMRFWELIDKLVANGKTIFVTTHYMDEAERCNRIALMKDGKIAALDTPENLKKLIFPMPIYEFEPKGNMTFDEISALMENDKFMFVEPYGRRFHVAFKDVNPNLALADLSAKFSIHAIKPTLEDVFIKTVEVKAQ